MRALGRNKPPDWEHLTAKPLSAARPSTPKPVAIGVNWYTSFDEPVQLHDGSWHVPNANREDLGSVRGGHCFCLIPLGGVTLLEKHKDTWWTFYDQGAEGACEGFGHAKAQSFEKATTFDAWFLYDEARKIEGSYPEGEGATNRGVMQVLERDGAPEQLGQAVATRGAPDGPVAKVAAIRWTIHTDEVLNALGRPGAHAVPFSNSWGTEYPLVTWMPTSTLDRLLREEGEADCATDA